MEIKKSLWLLIKWSLITTLMVSCQSLGIKNRPRKIEVSEKDPVQDESEVVKLEKPEFLKKTAPRLGVILGAGGALSAAHVGFLQELEKQKVPVHAIAGMEWGALVAGAYSLKAKAHAMEWSLLKLPYKNFESRSFFSSKSDGTRVNQFEPFLKELFKNQRVSDAEIPFLCSYVNLGKEQILVQNRGYLRNAVRNCLPSPPHFAVDTVAADFSGISTLAKNLRRQGAEIVIYVDVLTGNQMMSAKERSASPASSLLWSQAKSFAGFAKKVGVDEVIRVPLKGSTLTSYKSMRSLIRTGQLKTKSSIRKMVKKYDY